MSNHIYEMHSATGNFKLRVWSKSLRIISKDDKGEFTDHSPVYFIKQPMDFDAAFMMVEMLDRMFKFGMDTRSKEFKKLLG